MTDSFRQGIIALINSALCGKAISLPDDFDIVKTAEYAKKNELVGLIYYGAINCGVDASSSSMQELFNQTCRFLMISERQVFTVEQVCKAFDENGIDYMPVKGTLMKNLYPKPDMRVMGDADILIKVDQYDKIAPVMEGLGFSQVFESDHEIAWRKPELFVELHKRLIPSYNNDYFAYYGDGWQLGRPCDNRPCRFEMSDEDQMIYLFTHFAKHYRDGGIGVRHLVDLYVYSRAKTEMNAEYLKTELGKLQLFEFYENIMNTLSVWFDGAKGDQKTEMITDTIFGSGIYGNRENHIAFEGIKDLKATNSAEGARRKRWLRIVFLPYKNMCQKYPFLEKFPFLLPIMWVVRWISTLLFKQDKIKKQQDDMKNLTADKIVTYQQALNFVGLDFNFKE